MKKIIIVLITLMTIFTLVGCGSKQEETTETNDGEVVIKIGCSGPLTGDAAVYGIAVKNAAELAVKEINDSDSKIKFEFKIEDDEADTEKAKTAYAALYDWGMQASLFTVTSGSGGNVAELYDEDKIFALTPSGSSTALVYTDTKNYKGNFQMCFTDPNQGVASADYMKANFADKKIAIIYKNDDIYSNGVYEKFKAQASANGLNIVFEGAFGGDDTDFSSQIEGAKNAEADLVYLPIYYQPASIIFKQAKDKDYAPIFFGIDGMDGILNLENFDTSLAEGVYLLTPFAADAQDEATKHFVGAFEAAYNETPNQFAADAYDCVYAIKKALENIGIDNIDPDNLYDALINQFNTMTFDGVTGTSVTWAENGEVTKAPKANIIKNGTYVSAD